MTPNPPRPQLAPAIRATLCALRRRVRAYVWLQGAGVAAAWLGVAFWASLAIDWLFEPAAPVRGIILGLAIAVLAWLVYRWIVRRAFAPLADHNLAMLLERRYPQFNESLLTAVELTGLRPAAEEYDAGMLARTCRRAEGPVQDVRLRQVFNVLPLAASLLAAVLLVGSVAVFGVLRPEMIGVWARRSLAFSDELWPRWTRLVVEGFDRGTAKVARGSDIDVIVKADLRMPRVPEAVEIRYRPRGGSAQEVTMSREGLVDPSRDRYQQYTHTFRGVLAPIVFDVAGGDAVVRDLMIQVVDSPGLVETRIECRYPRYMRREPRSFPATGVMPIPLGSEVTLRARANKPLVRVQISTGARTQALEDHRGVGFREFDYTLLPFREDKTVLLTLHDADGLKSREPVRLSLAALADQAPRVAVQLRGIGPAITAEANLPVAGRITDDYGIDKAWFEYLVDQGAADRREIESLGRGGTDAGMADAFDVRALKLKPGQKLLLSVKAADCFDLVDQANVGASDQWPLDVVTARQLQTMLEAREVVLRQRFQAVLEEVTGTRDSLVHLEFGPATQDDQARQADKKAAEPGDTSTPPVDTPERRLAMRTLRVERALQDSQKNALETAGVSEAFGQIREELINNRIYTEELRIRIEEQIVRPLDRVVGQMFPELDRRLDRLNAAVGNESAGPENRDLARQQADLILQAMREVLSRMVELEDYNEAVDLLRSIIASQERVREATIQLQKEKLRSLLEEKP